MASRNSTILGGFHRDLRIEDEVPGQLRELGHQLKSLGADGCELVESATILPPFRHTEIFERHVIRLLRFSGIRQWNPGFRGRRHAGTTSTYQQKVDTAPKIAPQPVPF
jgi:hypothetical protein